VTALLDAARAAGCYKVILDCAEHNVAFYERAGLARKGVEMVRVVALVYRWIKDRTRLLCVCRPVR
jgi:glucosamine-phosphate N-acetyltransferase